MKGILLLPVAVLLLVLGGVRHTADAQVAVNFTKESMVVNTINGSIQIYPPVDVQPTDNCPDASWKHWKLHKSPPNYDPFHWSESEWREYLVNYPLRSAGLSIAFLLIGLGALLVSVTWRLVQWCISCGHCQRGCGVGSDDYRFLRDTKHRYLKAWIYLLIAGALSMVIWGMLALDRNLMASFWDAYGDVMNYGKSLNDKLETLKTNITETVPTKLQMAVGLVNETVDASRLESLVQTSLDFNSSTLAAANSVYVAAGSFLTSLNDNALPGLAALAGQFGSPIDTTGTSGSTSASGSDTGNSSSRRRLTQSAPSYDTLYGLLPALKTSLPVIISANATRASIHSRLQALSTALSALQTATSLSPDAPAVTQLAAALSQTTLDLWDSQLVQIVSGLQVYNASRSSPAFGDARKSAGEIIAAASSLSPGAVSQLQSGVGAAADQINNGTVLSNMKSLRLHLRNINQEVIDVSGWSVPMDNGTTIGILDLSNFVVGAIDDYILGGTDNDLGDILTSPINTNTTANTMSTSSFNSSIGVTNVTAFLQAANGISTLIGSLNASAITISAAALSGAAAVTGGPNPSAAFTQVNSGLRPTLSHLSNPIAAVAAALALYNSDPSAANAAALRIAATNATSLVNIAAVSFTSALVNTSSLESTSRTLQPIVDKLQAQGSSFVGTAPNTYSALSDMGAEAGLYQTGLGQLLGIVSQLPDVSDAKVAISAVANDIQTKVSEASADVEEELRGAASGLDNAAKDLQSKVLSPGEDFMGDHRNRTEDINRIGYSAAMGAWGLGAALLLLLALSVYCNWTGGLVTFGLALLLYIILSQAVTSVVSFAMGTLEDACNDMEVVMMRQLVEHSNSPKAALLLSFYFYKIPNTPDLMLEAAFDLNVTDVRMRLDSVNQTLANQIESKYLLQGAMAGLVNVLHAMGTNARTMFEGIMTFLRYETVHLLYMNTKNVACCEAGNFAFHEWCAITAMATLSFGALIAAAYLLARMDMVSQRQRGCCSCCSCDCYEPQQGIREDEEAARKEDEFVKEAKKKQLEQMRRFSSRRPPPSLAPPKPQLYHYQQQQQQQHKQQQKQQQQQQQQQQKQQQQANPLYGTKAPGNDGRGGFLKGGPGVVLEPQLPTGFMTPAGGAAAAAALKCPEPDIFSSPIVPPSLGFIKK